MRFKKLRRAVGIALVIFIFVVANIIAFGLVQEKLVTPIETKKDNVSKLVSVGDNIIKNNPAENQPVPDVPVTSAPPVQPTIVHKTRSRAS